MINWIFCDEKLPSANEWVIILVVELDYGQEPSDSSADWSLDTDEGFFDGKNWNTVNDWDEGQPWKVIAWSPKSLPSLDVVKEHWRKHD